MFNLRLSRILNVISYTRNNLIKTNKTFVIQNNVVNSGFLDYSKKQSLDYLMTENETTKNVQKPTKSPAKSKNLSDFDKIVSIIDSKGNNLVLSLGEAKKFAKKNNLELVREKNTGDKLKFKYVKVSDLVLGDKNNSSTKNKEKIFLIDPGIENHDLQTKINNIIKSLNKGHNVYVTIKNSKDNRNKEKLDPLIKHLENEIGKSHSLREKKMQGAIIKMKFIPSVSNTEKKDENSVESEKKKLIL